jgi:hypothetical protein
MRSSDSGTLPVRDFSAPALRIRCRAGVRGMSLVEAVVAVVILGLFSVGVIEGLLVMNRNAASVRVMTLAKAEVVARIQDILAVTYVPGGNVPAELALGRHSEAVTLWDMDEAPADSTRDVRGTLTTVVEEVPNEFDVPIRRVTVTLDYTYRGRIHSFSMFTMRSPDA